MCKRVPCVLSIYASKIDGYMFPVVWADAAREAETVGWEEDEAAE